MSPVVALSGGSQGGEFTSAFGGVAEVHGWTASAAFDANDPMYGPAVRCKRFRQLWLMRSCINVSGF
jgi:hypothetical protein